MSTLLKSVLSWVVTLLTPIVIVMLGVRLLLTPVFLQVEYRMPGFPADTYGFNMEDRIRWATPSLLYLINDQGIGYLGELMFDDGAPIYNARELSHMHDVKGVVQMLLGVWDVSLVIMLMLGIWASLAGWLDAYRAGWRRGGFFMLGLLVALAVFAVTSFWSFFSWFHSLFFTGDSWIFFYSDTLIRLFPIRFWEDCFAYVGVFSLVVALLLVFGLKASPSRASIPEIQNEGTEGGSV